MIMRDQKFGKRLGRYIQAKRVGDEKKTERAFADLQGAITGSLIEHGIKRNRIFWIVAASLTHGFDRIKYTGDKQRNLISIIADKEAPVEECVRAIEEAMNDEWNDCAGLLAWPVLTDFGRLLYKALVKVKDDTAGDQKVRMAAISSLEIIQNYLKVPDIPWIK